MVVPFVEIGSSSHGYFLHGSVLCRKWVPQGECFVGDPVCQFVAPRKFQNSVLHICHDNLTEHQVINKTHDQVLQLCFWPCLRWDVSEFVKMCCTCQLIGKPNQSISPSLLFPIPVVQQTFEYCVG